ncbi:MAG: hypothetical protein WC856_26150 [Methylococcaceae bacterium]|jgi:hypothetical protein
MNLRLPKLSNNSLEQATDLIGCTDDYLISLGVDGKLKFYVRPKNWAYRKHSDPLTAHIINSPIWIDDPVYLEKLLNGVESVMYFSAQYPDGFLEDLDVPEIAMFEGGSYELTNQQLDDLKMDKRVSVRRDEVSTQLGVPITKDRLVIKLEDLEPFLPKQQQSKVKAVEDDGAGSNVEIEPAGVSDEEKKQRGKKRTTKLNDWLREKWDEWGKPNAKDFAAKLKPFQGALGSPVKKYHGWHPKPNIVFEWQPGWGSSNNSWQLSTFANKVDDFKREDREATEKNCQ